VVKKKNRTIQDVIEDIRELHAEEEELLKETKWHCYCPIHMELEEKTDIDE